MSEPEKNTAVQDEPSLNPEIEVRAEPLTAQAQVERYLKRKAEVTEQDYREFQSYLEEKSRQVAPLAPPPPKKKFSLSRRNALKIVAGTAVAGEAAALGYSAMTGSNGKSAGAATGYGVQKQGIRREMTDSAADIGGRSLGRWVALLPTKMGGGTYALDLHSNRVLSSVWYWNYGDYNPISHHLCAFPSADPYHSFEFVNSTQGGRNSSIYDIQPGIANPAPGFHIYRVRYDGQRMSLMEDVAAKTGLGLGVHVTINPADAQSYFVTDGQKDIAACFDRQTSDVIAALKFDWAGNSPNLSECWQKGGTLTISKIYPDPTTGKFDYEGTKGQKIEWEMVPMGELYVEENQIPGESPHTLSGADGTIWHPGGRWAATVVRLCGGIAILDRDKNFDPVAFLQFNKDSQDQYPVRRIDDDHWEVVFDKIKSPGHEIGFSPDGKFLCMMNNLRENNCSVFDSSDPDPTKWKKVAHIEDPLWGGKYPNPFHMVFSIDGSKLYLSVLHPTPSASGIMVVDTKTWTIKKEIQGIGPDLQTPAITYDGKYVLCPFSGFQRLSSGIAVVDTETDDLIGILPSNGGHHDCVIIPTKIEHMKHTRSCTL
jgi:thiocyanate desulfurase